MVAKYDAITRLGNRAKQEIKGPISLNVWCMDNVADQNCRNFNFLNLKANSDYISDL